MKRFVLVLALGAVLGGCSGGNQTETPTQALEAIIKLYEAKDFDTLIRTRYEEIGKTDGEEDILALIEKFETRFQNDQYYDDLISTMQEAVAKTPVLSEGDTVALFPMGNTPGRGLKLYKMPSGKWGFHI